jgi:hypothetical protein
VAWNPNAENCSQGTVIQRILVLFVINFKRHSFQVGSIDCLCETASRSLHILRDLICRKAVIVKPGIPVFLLILIEDLGNIELSEMVMKFVCESEDLKFSNGMCRLKLEHPFSLDRTFLSLEGMRFEDLK